MSINAVFMGLFIDLPILQHLCVGAYANSLIHDFALVALVNFSHKRLTVQFLLSITVKRLPQMRPTRCTN